MDRIRIPTYPGMMCRVIQKNSQTGIANKSTVEYIAFSNLGIFELRDLAENKAIGE